jgi:hypothetical protein
LQNVGFRGTRPGTRRGRRGLLIFDFEKAVPEREAKIPIRAIVWMETAIHKRN